MHVGPQMHGSSRGEGGGWGRFTYRQYNYNAFLQGRPCSFHLVPCTTSLRWWSNICDAFSGPLIQGHTTVSNGGGWCSLDDNCSSCMVVEPHMLGKAWACSFKVNNVHFTHCHAKQSPWQPSSKHDLAPMRLRGCGSNIL